MSEELVLPLLCLLVLVLSVALFVLHTTRCHSTRRSVRIPYVPGKLPFIGHGLWINLNKMHIVLQELSQKYGGIFAVKLFREEFVVLSSYDAIYEALVEKGRDIAGRPNLYRTEHAQRNKHSIVWQTYTPKLQLLRKHVQKYVRVYGTGMDLLEDRCNPEIFTLIKRFERTEGSAVDPWTSIYSAVCNVMILLLLGKRLDHSDPDFQRIVEINELFNETFGSGNSRKLDFLPWRRCLKDVYYDNLQKALKLRDDFFAQQILPLKNGSAVVEDCIIKSLLDHQALCSDAQLDITGDTVKEVFTNLLLAGTDTTATALACLLLILLHYPDVQRKLHNEIDHVIAENRLPSLRDKQYMPYMEAVLMELLRYISHVPLAVPHAAVCDTEIQGYHIPAGQTIYINLWALHHDETFWKQPWQFIPERFLDSSGHLISADHENRRRLLPFGAGRRVCLGETLGKNRLYLFASALLQHYQFEPVDSSNLPDVDPRHFTMGLVLHPQAFQLRAIMRRTSL